MKYSTQPTESSLETDFGPEWSNRLSTTVTFTPELVIIEQEAWKDQVNFKDGGSDTPRPVDPWGLLTSPQSPQKTRNICDEGNEEGGDDKNDDETSYAGSGCKLGEEYDLRHWTLVRYDRSHQGHECDHTNRLDTNRGAQDFAKKIVLYVFAAVVLHGMWTHRNDSSRSGTCSCHCPKRAVGND